MQYSKSPLTIEEQADKLIKRGLIADKDRLIYYLKNISYYRLTGYLYPYRQTDSDNYRKDTTFEKVWRHYTFDRRLRLVVMDAIERIEISVRAQLIDALANRTGAFGYTNQTTLPKLTTDEHTRWFKSIKSEIERSKEIFVKHFKDKYSDYNKDLPLWMAAEIMSFGCMLTMYRGIAPEIKRKIAQHYDIPDEVLTSWLQTLNVIRNICAHHGRLWNRELGYKPKLPTERKYPDWHKPVPILVAAKIPKAKILSECPEITNQVSVFFNNIGSDYFSPKPDITNILESSTIPEDLRKKISVLAQCPHKVFLILTISRYLLKIIAPRSRWKDRLLALLEEYPEISRWGMGFPDNWKESPIWK